MDLHLLVVAGPDKGRAFPVHEGPDLLVGRAATAYYQLHDPQVGRNHCQVLRQEDKVTVLCNEGAGGTFVNGIKIERRTLQEGDVLKIGDTQLRFHVGEVPPEEEPPDEDIEVVEEEPGPSLEDWSGQHFAHFDLGPVLGQGRVGVVFKATDAKKGHTVALKVLREEIGQDDGAVKRFVQTMKLVLPLRHPHLVTVQAAGKTGPHCWVAMDYIEGKTALQVMEHVRKDGTPDWRVAYKVALQIAKALDCANQHGLIHGHITPTNILRDAASKTAKIGDLMLTRAIEEANDAPLGGEDEPEPDFAYFSPERTNGWADVDARSDLYGLGATLYGLLTGRPPFTGKTVEQLVARVRDLNPEKPTKYQPATPPWLEKVVLRLLAKKRKDRYKSAADLLMDLEEAARLGGEKV